MGILNPKGNLYSKVPLNLCQKLSASTGLGRNPMSPLPEPPTTTVSTTAATPTAEADVSSSNDVAESISHQPRTRTSIVDVSDANNQSFTTSIYLNQSTSQQQQQQPKQQEPECTSSSAAPTTQHVIPAKSYEPVSVVPQVTSSGPSSSIATPTTSGIKGIKWSVYLSKTKPTRHVTVIPINNNVDVEVKTPPSPTEDQKIELTTSTEELQKKETEEVFDSEHFYDAIFELEEPAGAANAQVIDFYTNNIDQAVFGLSNEYLLVFNYFKVSLQTVKFLFEFKI